MNVDNVGEKNVYDQKLNPGVQQLLLSSFVGSNIISREGDTLGRLHDVMIDISSGKIEYVIIEFGGFLGLNQKYFTMLFDALTLAQEHRHAFIIDETKESMKRFLSFDKEHLPAGTTHNTNSAVIE